MRVVIDGILYVPAPPAAEGLGLDAALDVRFDSDAGDQLTIREYFRELLTALWNEGESFSGKRPFGNSGWEYEPMCHQADRKGWPCHGWFAARVAINRAEKARGGKLAVTCPWDFSPPDEPVGGITSTEDPASTGRGEAPKV